MKGRKRDTPGPPSKSSSHVTSENFPLRLQETRGAVKRLEEELHQVKQRMEEMEAFYKVQLHRGGLAEMESFYKDKLQKERAAVKESKEELRSFKDRVAGDITVSLKTADLESMNSPVNATRLKELEEGLIQQVPKVKKYLSTTGSANVNNVHAMIQQHFETAARNMEEKKGQIQQLFDLSPLSSGCVSEKVTQYRQLSLQNLQLAVFHCRKEAAAQQPHSEFRVESAQDVEDFFSRCYWVGCLMALNEPPLPHCWGSRAAANRALPDQRPPEIHGTETRYC